MAYLFILLGVLFLGIGIFMLSEKQVTNTQTALEAQHSISQKTADFSSKNDKEKGDLFEDYVIQRIGHLNGIQFVGKSADYHKNGISGKENREPDLKFTYHHAPFAVECKWRSRFIDGKLQWAEDYQVKNYNRYAVEAQSPVYVCIGVGGAPAAPASVYLIPLKALKYGFGTIDYLQQFQIKDDRQLLHRLQK